MGTTLKCGIPRPGIPVQLFWHLWVHGGRGPRCRRCQGGGGQDGACGREPLLDWMRSVGLAAAQSLKWGFRFPTSAPAGSWIWSRGSVEQSLWWGVHSPTRLEWGEQDAAAAPPRRKGTRSTGATKSTAAEESLRSSSVGEYAKLRRLPWWLPVGRWPGNIEASLLG